MLGINYIYPKWEEFLFFFEEKKKIFSNTVSAAHIAYAPEAWSVILAPPVVTKIPYSKIPTYSPFENSVLAGKLLQTLPRVKLFTFHIPHE